MRLTLRVCVQAITQERRRYGFVLERQCSLAKHYLAYHSLGSAALQRGMDEWREVARTREFLPEAVDTMFCNRMRVRYCVFSVLAV
jgi:BAI1-associated protein 2